VAQFRADEPRLSVSSDPHPGELASYAALDPPILLYEVSEVSPPAIDPRLQRLLPVQVELVDNEWREVWIARDATEQEIADFDEANRPPPRWVEFGAAVQVSVPVIQLMTVALEQLPPLGLGLAVGLGKAEDGKPASFLSSWTIARSLGMVTPEIAAELAELAQNFNLPASFVDALVAV
jgi:hypothetical protein